MEEEGLFLGIRNSYVLMLRTLFISGQISPDMLHEATGVDIKTCIDFCAKSLAEYLYGHPPDIGGLNEEDEE